MINPEDIEEKGFFRSGFLFQQLPDSGSKRRILDATLPDAKHFPTSGTEDLVNFFVPPLIGFQFALPKPLVRLRAGIALRAAVPKASVYEDGDFPSGPCKIWPPENLPVLPISETPDHREESANRNFG